MRKRKKGREEGSEGDLGESKVRLFFCALSLLPVAGQPQVRLYPRREKKHVTFRESSKQNSMLGLRGGLPRQVKQSPLLCASVVVFFVELHLSFSPDTSCLSVVSHS